MVGPMVGVVKISYGNMVTTVTVEPNFEDIQLFFGADGSGHKIISL